MGKPTRKNIFSGNAAIIQLDDHLVQKLLLSSAALLSFCANFDGDFVFDDSEAIVNNPDVNGRNGIFAMFDNDFWGHPIREKDSHKSYRPLTILSFRINYHLSGLDTRMYHLANLLLHTFVTLLMNNCTRIFAHQLCADSSKSSSVSFLAAFLFAVHPIHTECVANITGRSELLMTLLALLAISHYSRMIRTNFVQWEGIFIVILLAFSAMLCKEQGIVILTLCMIYDWLVCRSSLREFPNSAHSSNGSNNNLHKISLNKYRPLAIRCSVLLSCTFFMLLFRLWIMNFEAPRFSKFDNPASFEENFIIRIINYQYIWCLNLWLLFIPGNLCFDYSMGCIPLIREMTDPRLVVIIFSFLLVPALIVAIFRNIDSSYLFLSLCFLAIPFLPASNVFFPVGFVLAERVLYLPSVGFCLFLANCLFICRHKLEAHSTNWSFSYRFALTLLLFLWTVKSIKRSVEWRTESQLYRSGAIVCPQNAKIQYNLAKILSDGGFASEAQIKYRDAIRLNPNYEQALNNLANLLERDGRFRESRQLLLKTVHLNERFSAAWMNLGIVETALGSFNNAQSAYRKALNLRPVYPDCLFNLGNLYLEWGKWSQALEAWTNATVLKPNHSKLILLDDLNDCKSVISTAKKALHYVHENSAVHFSLGSCLGKMGNFEKAEYHLLTAIQLDSNTASYYGNLGVLYHRWKRFDLAEIFYRKALFINAEMHNIRTHLRSLETK